MSRGLGKVERAVLAELRYAVTWTLPRLSEG